MAGLLDEAYFGAEFGVADAMLVGAVGHEGVVEWQDEMELHVGDDAVVDFVSRGREGGSACGCAVGEFEGVHLEVAVFDGVGVVGLEGRTGMGGHRAETGG